MAGLGAKFRNVLLALVAGIAVAQAEERVRLPGFLSGQTAGAETTEKLPGIRFVTTLDFPPFNYLDANGKLNGFNVYLAKAICAELSVENACTIQAVPFKEMESILDHGQADASIAGLMATAQSRETHGFTDAYLRFPARFVASGKQDMTAFNFDAGLKDIRIGVIAGSPHEAMARAFFPQAQVIGYAVEDMLFADLVSGKQDLVFGDAMRLSFWLNGTQSDGCCNFVGGAYYSNEMLSDGMRIAVPADKRNLVGALNVALRSLQRKGTIAELYLRFFPKSFY